MENTMDPLFRQENRHDQKIMGRYRWKSLMSRHPVAPRDCTSIPKLEKTLSSWHSNEKLIVQPKFDGYRCQVHFQDTLPRFVSRNGNIFPHFEQLKNLCRELSVSYPEVEMLDCELMHVGGFRQLQKCGNPRRKNPCEDEHLLYLVVFDGQIKGISHDRVLEIQHYLDEIQYPGPHIQRAAWVEVPSRQSTVDDQIHFILQQFNFWKSSKGNSQIFLSTAYETSTDGSSISDSSGSDEDNDSVSSSDIDGDSVSGSSEEENSDEMVEIDGVVIRTLSGTDIVKYKESQEEDAKIIGVEGEGPDFVFVAKFPGGKSFGVRMRGTTRERSQMFQEAEQWIGKYVTVKFEKKEETTQVPRFPVGVALYERKIL